MKNTMSWDVILCSLEEIYVLGKNSSVILNMKAVHSSETLVHFCWSTEHHIPQECLLHNHCFENFTHLTCCSYAEFTKVGIWLLKNSKYKIEETYNVLFFN